ncbi:hypothetical protein [Wenyingzhuangia sp. IMCC45574]
MWYYKHKPEFENNCDDFLKDEEEAQRKLQQKLDAAGNARSQNGSLNPKSNIRGGITLTVIGVPLFLFVSIWIGGLSIITGISFIYRGNEQKKILKENEKLKNKVSNMNS